MRVTSSTQFQTTYQGLNDALGRVQDLQNQMSSGRRINRYSDAPADAVNALRLRAQQDDWNSWSKAATDAQSRLDVTDTSLQSASSIMAQIKQLTVGAANGALDDASKKALSAQVLQLRDQLADLANTHHLGSAIFGGFADNAVANVGGTWSYVGDNGQVKRQVGSDVVVTVNMDGKQVFGFNGPGPNVFKSLETLSADILSGDINALQADGVALDAHANNIAVALGSVGALVNRVDQSVDQGQSIIGRLGSQRSELENVDLSEVVLKLAQAQSGYQAALGAAAKASMPSLADFLR